MFSLVLEMSSVGGDQVWESGHRTGLMVERFARAAPLLSSWRGFGAPTRWALQLIGNGRTQGADLSQMIYNMLDGHVYLCMPFMVNDDYFA